VLGSAIGALKLLPGAVKRQICTHHGDAC